MTKELVAKELNFDQIELFFPPQPDSSRLLIGMNPQDYSASQIAHAVEDADARLLNLNVTAIESPEARLVVALRVNHRDPERVARSLERYGFSILNLDSSAENDDIIRRRYDELMRIINI